MNNIKKEVYILDKNDNKKKMKIKLSEITTSDLSDIITIYDEWVKYCKLLEHRNYRRANFPEGVSEDLVCILKKYYKLNQKAVYGCSTSFDCLDGNNGERIQVKASSSNYELTSFGPKSVFDRIYFLDFYYEGESYKKKFKFYEIDKTLIENAWVNKDETVTNQSDEGKRPRIRIRKLIEQNSISFTEYEITNTKIKKI